MLRAVAFVGALCALSACGGREPRLRHFSAPEPSGCYVEVFAEEEFKGPREFINGPAKHAQLSALPFGVDWHNRIKSIRVGSGAIVTVWAAKRFEGASITLAPERSQRRLSEAFREKVASVEIACSPKAAAVPTL